MPTYTYTTKDGNLTAYAKGTKHQACQEINKILEEKGYPTVTVNDILVADWR